MIRLLSASFNKKKIYWIEEYYLTSEARTYLLVFCSDY